MPSERLSRGRWFREIGAQVLSRGLRRRERSELQHLLVGPLRLSDHRHPAFVKTSTGLLAESQPFGLLGFGQCAGSIVVIRNAEMGRAVPCSAVQAPNLDATIRTGEAVGTIPPLIELCLTPRFVRRRVKGLGQFRVEWNPARHGVL